MKTEEEYKAEVLRLMRDLYPTLKGEERERAERLFPELKENKDEKIRKHLIRHFQHKTKQEWNGMPIKDIIAWLEKRGEQKPVWSAEDEKFFITALWHISNSISNGKSTDTHCDTAKWLKSLKDRVLSQNTWKPSDEQMNALDSTLHYSQVSHNSFEHLNSLFNDLKKLKEE